MKFLESEIPPMPPEQCRFHVIPAPMEHTVSYGGGTARGPEALLAASAQMEAFDGKSRPCDAGIYTTPPALTLDAVQTRTAEALQAGALPILLGGEHTVTFGALKALKETGISFGIIQFDAHADLRDTYEGSKWSHACVMRRAVDDLSLPLLQLGVRALSSDDLAVRKARNIPHYDGYEICRNGLPSDWIPKNFPAAVYVTFDADALDASVMPATGTPEPGGLTWWQAMTCLEQISIARRVVGFDFVELAPIPGLHACDFSAARLIYNFMGMILRKG